MTLMAVLIGGFAYMIFLLQQPTVIANEIVWAPNSTDTKYHRCYSRGTVMRREAQDYDWTPWREDEDYPKPPKGR